jgi:hypothetical protein
LSRAARLSAISSPRFAWFGRLLALMVLALFGAGHALPGLHHVLTPHVVCAEHGELTHSQDAGAHPAEPPSASDSLTASGEAAHAHEHCSLAGLAADPCPVVLGSSATRLPVQERARAPLAEAERAHSSVELLALAPKLAPPV